MRLLKDTPFQFGYTTWQLRPPEVLLSLVVKATFEIVPGGECVVAESQAPCSGERHYDDDPHQSVRFDTDLAVIKSRGECLLSGTCHPPGGQPARVSGVGFTVGDVVRSLAIFGDREWRLGGASEPAEFASMPLRWERCYGGPGFPANPLGVGIERVTGPAGPRRPLPNIEDPQNLIRDPGDSPAPHGAFPIPREWKRRSDCLGTYDEAWLRERWPYFAADFDPRYFQAAPPEQQIEGYWLGDEVIALQNLHPEYSRIEAWLPGLRARCGLAFREGLPERFREVPLVLDTISVDADSLRVFCTWRGVTAVASEKLADIERVFVAEDSIDDDALPEELRARFEACLAAEKKAEEVPPRPTPAPRSSRKPTLLEVLEPYREHLAKHNLTPEQIAASTEQPPTPFSLADARARVAEGRAVLAKHGVAAPDALDQVDRQLDVLERRAKRDASTLRQTVEARLAAGERSFAQAVLMGADLSGLDLSGVDFTRAILRDVKLTNARLDKAVLDGADLGGADLSGATLREASLCRTFFEEGRANGAVFDGAVLDNASLDKTALEGAQFRKARFARTRFTNCDLRRAVFVDAQGAGADFAAAQLERADFTRAALPDVTFDGALARELVLEDCDLTGLRASMEADLRGARLVRARADRANFRTAKLDGADLSYCRLQRANFTGANLTQAILDGCPMRQVIFREATMVGTRMLRADALEGTFASADLSHSDLRGSNLFGSEFHGARLEGAQLESANVKRTMLAR